MIGVVCSLQERHRSEWGDEKVKLLYGDMRTLEVPEKVDILVSELLGSFGDNELSPECLDGAMRFLKRKVPCVAFLSNAKLMDCSGWYLNTVVVHGIHRAAVLFQIVQRDESEQRPEVI